MSSSTTSIGLDPKSMIGFTSRGEVGWDGRTSWIQIVSDFQPAFDFAAQSCVVLTPGRTK